MNAQEKIHKKCLSDDPEKRRHALKQIQNFFSSIPDKQQAWNDLHTLTNDEDEWVRYIAVSALGSIFSQVPDKWQVWNDLIKLTSDENWSVRHRAATVLCSVFSHVPDKQKAWSDLIKLTNDENGNVRFRAALVLGSAFSHVPDKQQAWNDLHTLTKDKDSFVRESAAKALGSAFSHVPDKQQAWNDLHTLTKDIESDVRSKAALALGSAFSHVPDKQQAWNDLIKLTSDKESDVRGKAAFALGSAFSHVPDKQQAWNDLHKLIIEKDNYVRYGTIYALGSVFSHVPDKQQAWNDLIKLTSDKESDVRGKAALVLGSAFSQMPDKQQAWNDLIKLTSDKESDVRSLSNHSLGRASIFMASQAETDKDYKEELEKAIDFFETAEKEATYNNPVRFCLPFYRSFHAIIFKKKEAIEEVQNYLKEAKYAIEGSESKELLFKAVENLANALKEVQNLENLDLEAKKSELDFYRKYCDRAAELMRKTEVTAPYATAAMRKGLPILDRNLKELLEEIQKKTEVIREQTRGTQFEKLGNELNQNSQSLLQVRDQVGLEKQVNIMQNIMKNICSKFTENQKGEACELLNMMYAEPSLEDKIPLMNNILSKFSYQLDMTTNLKRIEEKLDMQLNHINFGIFKSELNSHNIISCLNAMKIELEKLNEIENLNTFSIEILNSNQDNKLNNFISDMLERFDEIKHIIDEFPQNNNTQELYQEYSKKLDELKQSKYDRILQRSTAFISLISFVIPMMITLAR